MAIIIGCVSGTLPPAGLLAFASVFLAVPTLRGIARHADDIPKLIPYMGKNVMVVILTPVLLAIGLFISG